MQNIISYQNPVIRGFYPDPSICKANGKYYLVCSSFQYFPGVPLFESTDLINWHQIGHVLTRKEQLPLSGADSHGGIYAPTLRYYDGRFYMVTTNVSGVQNFYVWTDDIYGEWSDVIPVDQDGIDPSLYFENGKAYFMSNHGDEDGRASIMQCEIDIETGKKLTKSRPIWRGCGGRYLESPHLYKIGDWYYLMAAEGGTEYGHMVVISRGKTPYGPFEASPANPIVSNRDLGGYPLQGTGHGDLMCDDTGNWWMVLLAFRQIDKYMPYHHLGREVCLIPVTFTPDGWVNAGVDGKVYLDMKAPYPNKDVHQKFVSEYTFSNMSPGQEWVFIRNPFMENYKWSGDCVSLRGTEVNLSDRMVSPTFLGLRQQEMFGDISVTLKLTQGEAGISLYMNYDHHYDFALCKDETGMTRLVKRRVVGDMEYIQQEMVLTPEISKVKLCIEAADKEYQFRAEIMKSDNSDVCTISTAAAPVSTSHSCAADSNSSDTVSLDFGAALTQYLSSEVAGGFTGVMIGLYATATGETRVGFYDFRYCPVFP